VKHRDLLRAIPLAIVGLVCGHALTTASGVTNCPDGYCAGLQCETSSCNCCKTPGVGNPWVCCANVPCTQCVDQNPILPGDGPEPPIGPAPIDP